MLVSFPADFSPTEGEKSAGNETKKDVGFVASGVIGVEIMISKA